MVNSRYGFNFKVYKTWPSLSLLQLLHSNLWVLHLRDEYYRLSRIRL